MWLNLTLEWHCYYEYTFNVASHLPVFFRRARTTLNVSRRSCWTKKTLSNRAKSSWARNRWDSWTQQLNPHCTCYTVKPFRYIEMCQNKVFCFNKESLQTQQKSGKIFKRSPFRQIPQRFFGNHNITWRAHRKFRFFCPCCFCLTSSFCKIFCCVTLVLGQQQIHGSLSQNSQAVS